MSYILDGRHVGKIIPELVVEKNVDGFVGKKTYRNVARIDCGHVDICYFHEGVLIKEICSLFDFYGFGTAVETALDDVPAAIIRARITKKSTLTVNLVFYMERYYLPVTKILDFWSAESTEDRIRRSVQSRKIMLWTSRDGWLIPEKRFREYVEKRKKREALYFPPKEVQK